MLLYVTHSNSACRFQLRLAAPSFKYSTLCDWCHRRELLVIRILKSPWTMARL